ncbi:MAG: PAS domain-containing sensor histidine kinase [Bacteroidota bacterium]
MSIIIIQKEIFKKIITSKLTWLLIILWAAFVVIFVLFDPHHLHWFHHWFTKGALHFFIFFIGFAGIFFFRYLNYNYIFKIDNQNRLLMQRERMLTRINEKLIKQSDFLKLVTNSFPHPFTVVDAESFEILMANKAFYQQHGLPEKQDLSDRKCYELSHHFTRPCNDGDHPCPLLIAKKTNKPVTAQHIHKDQTGETRIVEVNAFPVYDEKKEKVLQVIEYTVDITNKIHEGNLLAEREERLRRIITTSPDGISVIDLDGKITFASEKSAIMLGINHPEKLIGKIVFDLIPPEEIEKAKKTIASLIAGEKLHDKQEFRIMKQDGTEIYQEVNASLLLGKDNKPYSIILISRDITERKYNEEKLRNLYSQLEEKSLALEELNRSLEIRIREEVEANREKDRMIALQSRQAAMGEMIGNIAHQWRQPLNTINLIIFDMLEAQKHGELNDAYLQNSYDQINKVVQSMSQTIDDFRNFFKPNKQPSIFNINHTIDQCLNFTLPGMKAGNIDYTFKKNGEILVEGYPNELMQTLINIVTNAMDALAGKESGPKTIHFESSTNEQYASVRIYNNGKPIANEEMENIFDPYYSTKPEGQGTGLGLFIAKTIVEKNMNGKLSVRNTKNGVCFEIELPLSFN